MADGIGLLCDADVGITRFGKLFDYRGWSTGTLLHWSPVKQPVPLGAIPANGDLLVNLASAQGADLLGVTEATLQPTAWSSGLGGAFLDGELSSLGAPHIASTQAGAQNAAAWWAVRMPQPLYDWFVAGVDLAGAEESALAVACYYRITRKMASGGTSAQPISAVSAGVSANANHLGYAAADYTLVRPTGDPIGEGYQSLAASIGDPALAMYGASQLVGALPAYASADTRILSVGAAASFASAEISFNRAPSAILHEVFVDDLRFASRAGNSSTLADEFAAFKAEHAALWTAAYAEGGAYHGETFTAAATLKA